jgi:hypothetical protein
LIENNYDINNNWQQWMQEPPAINEQEAWADMKEKLQPKKKRRIIFWWWFLSGMGLLCIAALIGIFFSNQKSNNFNKESALIAIEKASKEYIKENKYSDAENKNNTHKKERDLNLIHKNNTTKQRALNLDDLKENKKVARKKLIEKSKDKNGLNNSVKEFTSNRDNLKKEIIYKSNLLKGNKEVVARQTQNTITTSAKEKKQSNKIKALKGKIGGGRKINVKDNVKNNLSNEVKNTINDALNVIDSIKNPTKIAANRNEQKIIDTFNKMDSSLALNRETPKAKNQTKKKENNKFTYGVGLDWHLPTTFTNSEFFLKDKNLKPNILNYFIPAVYGNVSLNKKHHLYIGFIPFAQYNVPSVNYDVISGTWKNIDPNIENLVKQNINWAARDSGMILRDSVGFIIDTNITVTRTNTLNKAFGYSLYTDYYYSINKNWQVGVGVIYNAVTAYLQNTNVSRNGITPSQIDSSIVYTTEQVRTPNESNNKINNHFISARLSLLYNFKKYAIGLQCTQPFTSITKEGEINRTSSFNILLRLKLF